jgi:hypothetical protein
MYLRGGKGEGARRWGGNCALSIQMHSEAFRGNQRHPTHPIAPTKTHTVINFATLLPQEQFFAVLAIILVAVGNNVVGRTPTTFLFAAAKSWKNESATRTPPYYVYLHYNCILTSFISVKYAEVLGLSFLGRADWRSQGSHHSSQQFTATHGSSPQL